MNKHTATSNVNSDAFKKLISS